MVRLFIFFLFLCYPYSSSYGYDEFDVVCLGKGFFIGLDQEPEFEIIRRVNPDDSNLAVRFLSGRISVYALYDHVLAGAINVDHLEDVFIGTHEKNGYFIIDFKTEQITSGMTKEETIKILKYQYLSKDEQVNFLTFNLLEQPITKWNGTAEICQ